LPLCLRLLLWRLTAHHWLRGLLQSQEQRWRLWFQRLCLRRFRLWLHHRQGHPSGGLGLLWLRFQDPHQRQRQRQPHPQQ
jgi:hypothetical protein